MSELVKRFSVKDGALLEEGTVLKESGFFLGKVTAILSENIADHAQVKMEEGVPVFLGELHKSIYDKVKNLIGDVIMDKSSLEEAERLDVACDDGCLTHLAKKILVPATTQFRQALSQHTH